jgi:hypothetical protein
MSPWPARAGHGDMAAPRGIPESCLKSATVPSQGDQEPPFGADGESIPVTALAMPIRVFCAPPADHAAEITGPPGGPPYRCELELAAPVWRSVSGTQVNRAAWLLAHCTGWRPGRVGCA